MNDFVIFTVIISAWCFISLINLILFAYIGKRNNEVYLFRQQILEYDWDNYNKLQPYNKMLFSFKKLNKENFLKKEETNESL
ncbi:MAG: hypothetical protein WC389_03655 [Lutibacter sp.]|jgi:hypothetical protein